MNTEHEPPVRGPRNPPEKRSLKTEIPLKVSQTFFSPVFESIINHTYEMLLISVFQSRFLSEISFESFSNFSPRLVSRGVAEGHGWVLFSCKDTQQPSSHLSIFHAQVQVSFLELYGNDSSNKNAFNSQERFFRLD